FVVGKADKIIAVSKTNAKYLENNFKFDLEKLEIITNGFDVKKILTLDISKKEKLIVFNTKWISVKNPDITALAFRKLAKKYPKWRFLFTGRGESIVQTFDNHPKNFEVIERFLSQEELFDLLSKSSIYVNSSHNEGLSLGIVEATGLGNIPVLSDAPGNIEVATKLLTKRFVFERNNYSSLITSIEKAIRACENKKIRQTRIHIANRSRKYFANTKTFRKYRSFLSRYRLIKSFKGAKSSKLSYSYT
ncbi:glycosyltransferase family 4 protein, partial [Candidatus Dojkabacteria bacterium]|nr:glycosyltransferase family 4 protein [Candidatus Dojkabacteria bacterium]